jgi:hypothetical protein
MREPHKCPVCKGTGTHPEDCHPCNGKGIVWEPKQARWGELNLPSKPPVDLSGMTGIYPPPFAPPGVCLFCDLMVGQVHNIDCPVFKLWGFVNLIQTSKAELGEVRDCWPEEIKALERILHHLGPNPSPKKAEK